MKPLALAVENDAGTRRLLDVLLTRAGYETDCVATGAEGLVLIDAVEYSVIVLDLLMPGRTGFDVLATLQHSRPQMLERTLVLTSAARAALERVRDEFGVPVIRKPFEIAEILEAVATRALPVVRPAGIRETFCRASMREGARSGLLLRVNGDHLDLVTDFGYASGFAEQYCPLPLDGPFPICGAARERRPAWLGSIDAAIAQYPDLLPFWTANDTQALAAVPLIRHADVLGAAGWSFRTTRRFSEPEQRALQHVVDVVAERFSESAINLGA